jgi:hypothetical protein
MKDLCYKHPFMFLNEALGGQVNLTVVRPFPSASLAALSKELSTKQPLLWQQADCHYNNLAALNT